MSPPTTVPYGSWTSPITADRLVQENVGLDAVVMGEQDIYWIETRPTEQGRNVIVRIPPAGAAEDLLPAPYNARSRANEYGGAPYWLAGDHVVFSNDNDRRLYALVAGKAPDPITPAGSFHYADGIWDAGRERVICVREDHSNPDLEPVNTIVTVSLAAGGADPVVLAGGHDFCSSPRLSPDGSRLAWLTWDHPNMPWDGTELWQAAVRTDGTLGAPARVAGGPAESVFQPEWSPDGALHFVSDRSGWWNLYRHGPDGDHPLCPLDAEFGLPQWVFGMSTYAFTGPGQLVCAVNQAGTWSLATIDHDRGTLDHRRLPFTVISQVRARDRAVVFLGASPTMEPAVVRCDLDQGGYEILRSSSATGIGRGYLSAPETIEFPTTGGQTAHAFYYPPANADHIGPAGEHPPLLVKTHGGPTSATTNALDLRIQYWTSRGIGVVDVNYGGSTGYGRAYRERLNDQWGVVDVDDCVHAAEYLVAQGKADGRRLVIRGGSAGGYTTLAALTFRQVFAAGASYYGISDLETMTTDTHKFESRYLDRLVGPYPAERDRYRARSPIHFTDRLSCPLILFQGTEDKVVPPDQSERVLEALRAKGLPVAYLAFEGEQHGFRMADTVKRSLEAELYFYGRILGFTPSDEIEPVTIENLG